MAYVNVYDNGGGIRKVPVLDNARNIIGTTTDGGQTGANLAAELAAIRSPVTRFQCGMPFVMLAGDGGSNGALFSGVGGAFTLSAEILAFLTIPSGYGYLPANSGGLGNAAGWYYFTMSSTTAGVFYNNAYSISSEVPPAIPVSPTPFADGAGGRLAQSTAEITCCQITLPAGYVGANGLISLRTKTLATSSAGLKTVLMRAASTGLLKQTYTTSANADFEQWSQMAGRIDSQINGRYGTAIGTAASSIAGDVTSINFAISTALTVTTQSALQSDSMALFVRQITIAPGE